MLNFFGSASAGKRWATQGVALRLSKPLYQVDYSAVISKYLGDTAKHIKAAFAAAREHEAVLFFDEADEGRACSCGDRIGTEAAGSAAEGQAEAKRPAGFGVRYCGRR